MARRPLPGDENGPRPRRNPSDESRREIVTMGHNRER
jgi:hypothetical protein